MADETAQMPEQRRPRKRLAKRKTAVRDMRIMECLTAGLAIDEIAARERITPQWTRKRVAAIVADRPADPPRQFVHLQIRRLSEALLVAYTEMNGGNLHAVDRVVKLVRELERYHGFGPAPATPLWGAPELTADNSAALPAPALAPLALAPPTPQALVAQGAFDAPETRETIVVRE